MKKLLLSTMSAMLLCISVFAQSPITQIKDDYSVCAGKLTTSGKATLIAREWTDDEDSEAYTVSIYNDQMSIAKTINVAPKVLTYHTWTETAKVVPTGFSFAFYYTGYDYETGERYENVYNKEPDDFNIGMDFSEVKTPEQLVQKLVDAGRIPAGECYPFIDFKGNMAFVSLYNTDVEHCFHFYETFGAKYPNGYFWTLIDGKIYGVDSSYSYGKLLYSTDNLVWNVDESTIVEHKSGGYGKSTYYYDYDEGTEWWPYLTQTFFNNDDKWEYCVVEPKVVPIPEEWKDISEPSVNEDGSITVTRKGGETTINSKIVIYNEDGVECFSVDGGANDLDGCRTFRLNGKDYFCADLGMYSCLYEIDKSANGIREVARAKSSRVKTENNAVIVEVDDDLSGSDVMIADTGGRLMGKGHIKRGNMSTRVAMPTHTPGVYIVSLKRGDKVLESHKMMIK